MAQDLTPNQAELRFPTRKAAKISNYKEDDDDIFEDEEDTVTAAYWANGPEDDTPAIDAVLQHRLREGTGNCPYPNSNDLHLTQV